MVDCFMWMWFLRSCWRVVAMALLLLGALWSSQAAATSGAAGAAGATPCAPQLQGSWAAREQEEGVRPAQGWVPAALPNDSSSLWPQWGGAVWYRVDWTLNCPDSALMPQGAQLALAVSGIRMAGTVYWNDERLWSDASLVEPYSRSWLMPRWWPVSIGDGSQTQTAWIRVVAAHSNYQGVGYVELGDRARIEQDYGARYVRQRTSYVVTASLSLTIACVALVVWIWRRSEKIYLWIGVMQIFWTLYLAIVLSLQPWPGLGSDAMLLLNLLFFMLYAHCFLIFVLRFYGQRSPRWESMAWGALAVWVVGLLWGDGYLSKRGDLSLVWGVVIFCVSCLYGVYKGVRSRSPLHWLLAATCLVMVIVAVHDIVVALRRWDNDQTWSYFSWPLNMVVLAVLLGWQVASHMRRVDRFNAELTEHVAKAKAELAEVLQQQHAKDLKSAKLQERVQLAHDLHDGLGGSLVRSMALVEQSPQPLSNDRMMSLLKNLRDDLRQVIDSGSSSGIHVPETPVRWIAPLRYRFMHILDEMGVQAQWQVEGQWHGRPSPLQCLGMLRFLEEALTNVIKHSQAHHVRVVSSQPEPGVWELTVQDDGTGFDWEAVQQAGISVGMRSMQSRLERIGGALQVQSRPGCTVLIARVRLTEATSEPA